jgi:hypothetical protein
MKRCLLLLICYCSSEGYSQTSIKGPWHIECGASSSNAFQHSSSLNMRYISPRFRWSDEYIVEEEKNPEKFKNMRLMLELIYNPPLKVLCTGFNAQYRLIHYKRFSFELYGGMKFFFLTGTDYAIPNSRGGRDGDIWYMNMGLLCQLDLGMVAPFADIGGDGIITVGTEINFKKIYRKPKSRYKLRAKPVNKSFTKS